MKNLWILPILALVAVSCSSQKYSRTQNITDDVYFLPSEQPKDFIADEETDTYTEGSGYTYDNSASTPNQNADQRNYSQYDSGANQVYQTGSGGVNYNTTQNPVNQTTINNFYSPWPNAFGPSFGTSIYYGNGYHGWYNPWYRPGLSFGYNSYSGWQSGMCMSYGMGYQYPYSPFYDPYCAYYSPYQYYSPYHYYSPYYNPYYGSPYGSYYSNYPGGSNPTGGYTIGSQGKKTIYAPRISPGSSVPMNTGGTGRGPRKPESSGGQDQKNIENKPAPNVAPAVQPNRQVQRTPPTPATNKPEPRNNNTNRPARQDNNQQPARRNDNVQPSTPPVIPAPAPPVQPNRTRGQEPSRQPNPTPAPAPQYQPTPRDNGGGGTTPAPGGGSNSGSGSPRRR